MAATEPSPSGWAARLASLVWWLLLALLLLFALYVGIGRQLTANIDRFRGDLAEALTVRLGEPVTVGHLSARWNWLDPTFEAENIRVGEPRDGRAPLRLDNLRIRPSFLASLARQRLVFAEFQADGLSLTIKQSEQQGLSIRGLDVPTDGQTRLEDLVAVAGEWLSEPSVRLTRVHLRILDDARNARDLDIPQLDLVYRRGLFRATGRLFQAGTTQQLARFALVGQQFFRGGFNGQVFVDVNSGRLFDALVDGYRWRGLSVQGFDLGGRVWLTFRDGQLEQANGQVKTPYLRLGKDGETVATLEDIQAKIGWRRTAYTGASGLASLGEWHLRDLQWQWNGEPVPPFSARLSPGPAGEVRLAADAVPLEPLRRLLTTLPVLSPAVSAALSDYKPAGYLDDARLRIPGDGDPGFDLTGALRDIDVQAHGGAPGVSGINGQLQMTAEGGSVRLSDGGGPVVLAFPDLFQGPWTFDRLTGTVAWSFDGLTTRVFADNLAMQYQKDTGLTGAFDLKLVQGGEDVLGLRIGVDNGNAGMLASFVPVHLVSPGLYQWLTESIQSARIVEGVYYGFGQIGAQAPRGSFDSSMRYRFDQATVQYDKQWPPVTEARGEVTVHNGDTRVALEGGLTGGLTLDPGTVTVTSGPDGGVVDVDASASVPGDAVPFWLDNSPLGGMAGNSVRSLTLDGRFLLDLSLSLPLAEGKTPVVEARVRPQNATVRYPEAGLAWQSVSGDLVYHSRRGFSGTPLKARFLGEPVTVSLRSARDGLEISQQGAVTLPQAFHQWGLPGDQGFGLSGRMRYRAGLTVSRGTASPITLTSDLSGVAVDWPEPLGKAAAETAPLTVTLDPASTDGLAIGADWGTRLAADLRWKDTGFDLMVKRLALGDRTLHNIAVNGLSLPDRWVVTTDSARAKGRLVIPSDGGPVVADFERVHLLRAKSDATDGNAQEELLTFEDQLRAFRKLDMGSWPDVNVAIASLQINDSDLGHWAFQLRPEPYRLRVSNMEARLNSLTLLGDLTWSVLRDREMSRFKGSITGGQLADLNQLFGAEIPLTNKKTDIELDIDWPGRPDAFSARKLSGSVKARLDDGVILQQSNTAQVFRIFNLLNADTLWRRLKLDFSDLYERGVAFDALSGKAQILNGLVTLDPELQIVGPSGAFKLSGTTDLGQETLDMKLVVVLPLTQNLPLAALLMGAAAPVGGALFVLDKLLGDPLSKLTSASYGVTGTWDDPQVKLRRVFDNGQ